MISLVKDKKAAIVQTKDGHKITYEKQFEFRDNFEKWKENLKKISSEDVLSTQGKNLYEQLQQHVTMATKRPKSKNSGTDGAFTLLDEIEGFLSTRTSFLLEDEDRIEDFIDEVNDFADETSSLNPQNILFTMPKKWGKKKVGNETKIVAIGREKVKIYGHYNNKYMAERYPDAGYDDEGRENWYSTSMGKSNPPLFQALFAPPNSETVGEGKGLIQVLEKGLEEVRNNKIKNLEITRIFRGSTLMKLSSVKKWLDVNIRKSNFYPSNSGKIKLSEFARALAAEAFAIQESDIPILMKAITKDGKQYSAEIETFSLNITPKAMSSLIKAYMPTRRSEYVKVRNGYYLTMAGLSNPPSESWKQIKKSWYEHLWRH